MQSIYKRLAVAGFFVILLFIAYLLPLRKISYAQNIPGSNREIIVVFKNRPTVSTLSALSTSVTQTLEIKNGIAASNAMVFSVPTGDVNTAMNELAGDPNVASVFPNYPLSLQAVPNDPMVLANPVGGLPRQQWNLYTLKLADAGQSAWDVTTGSPTVVVAVIDTGIASSHPEFAGKIASLVDCSSGTCAEVSLAAGMTDNHPAGHGTHVAGLVGAATNNSLGIASSGYNTKIMVIKVMDSTGETTTDNFFNAIKWAADHGAKVISTSFGIVADSLSSAGIAEYNNTIAYAWERGAVVVAAAGNCRGNTNGKKECAIIPSGNPNNITGYAQNSRMYPAASPNVISVAATTVDNAVASYSEQNDPGNPNIGNWISVAAPGGDGLCADSTKTCIFSTVPTNQYFWQSGTSMAAPQVAGVAALILAAKPSLTNEQVKNIIETTANHSILAGSNNGLVDALAALQAAVATSGNTTPTPSPTGGANLTPTLTLVPTSPATVSATPTTGPTVTPSVTPYPTTAPKLPKTFPSPMPAGPYCPAASSCAKKSQGDANCDGVVNLSDFNLWKQQFDTMVPASPPNQNANFACVEGNSSTYFVDLVDYEIWRRNTTSGLITPAPTSIPGTSPVPTGASPTPPPPPPDCLTKCGRYDIPNDKCQTACTSLNSCLNNVCGGIAYESACRRDCNRLYGASAGGGACQSLNQLCDVVEGQNYGACCAGLTCQADGPVIKRCRSTGAGGEGGQAPQACINTCNNLTSQYGVSNSMCPDACTGKTNCLSVCANRGTASSTCQTICNTLFGTAGGGTGGGGGGGGGCQERGCPSSATPCCAPSGNCVSADHPACPKSSPAPPSPSSLPLGGVCEPGENVQCGSNRSKFCRDDRTWGPCEVE